MLWKGTEIRCGHLSFSLDHSKPDVSIVILSRKFSFRFAGNLLSRLATANSTWRECLFTSKPPVPEMVRLWLSPCNISSSATTSVMYEPVEQGSSITFTFSRDHGWQNHQGYVFSSTSCMRSDVGCWLLPGLRRPSHLLLHLEVWFWYVGRIHQDVPFRCGGDWMFPQTFDVCAHEDNCYDDCCSIHWFHTIPIHVEPSGDLSVAVSLLHTFFQFAFAFS